MRRILVMALLAVSCLGSSLAVNATPLSSGITFKQVDFTYPGAEQIYSQYGQVFLDYSEISGSGYVNVKTSTGWVVQNMPVFGSSGLPGLSMMFDLGYSGPQTSPFSAIVDYSNTPIYDQSQITGNIQSFGTLGHVENNALDSAGSFGPPSNPAGKMSVTFDPNGLTTPSIINSIRPSVEQDVNQCGPSAIANSLDYLSRSAGIALVHQNIPGIAGNPKESMVGQIDVAVGRVQGQGVWRSDLLDGKLKYLDKFGPDNLVIKHQGVFDKNGAIVINGDRTQGNITSVFQGNLVTLNFLIGEIHHGEDVEMDMSFGGMFGAGHEIMVTGGDYILGRPWITFVHDAVQGDNNKGTGLLDGGYGFAWLDDPGNGNFINLKGYVVGANGLSAGVRNVITESVPEPTTVALILISFLSQTLMVIKRKFF